MHRTHYSILPIFAFFLSILLLWSTSSAQTVDMLTEQLREVDKLPSGSVFQLTLTDEDATSAASEYLEQYAEEIQSMVQKSTGIKPSFSVPSINFDNDRIVISIRGGVGFLKVTASVSGTVVWDASSQTLNINTDTVDIPIISVDPATINSYIQAPINDFIRNLMDGYEVLSFKINDGYAVLEAKKK